MTTTDPTATQNTTLWPLHGLRQNPHNPRTTVDQNKVAELAESIRSVGILQPLVITPDGLVVVGHRRLAAARVVRMTHVPVIVRDLSVAEQREIMLIENMQREDLTPLEEARSFRWFLDNGYTTNGLARKLGYNAQRVNTRIMLLNLEPEVQQLFHTGELAVTLAQVLLKVKDPIKQKHIATLALRRRLSVAALAQIVDASSPLKAPQTRPHPVNDDDDDQPVHLSRTRQQALDFLTAAANSANTISYGRLGRLFEKVCCSCGMADTPQICAICPLNEYMNEIAVACP
jgi:ParB/RepB/Spo0J family partition protein